MRKLIGFLIFITVLSWFQTSTICADIYIWKDANGVKHFANEAPSGNTDVRQQAEQKQDPDLQKAIDKKRSRTQDEMTGKVPVGSDERVTKNPGKVVIFTMAKEHDSMGLRSFLEEYHIAYTDYQINKDEEAKRRFDRLGGCTVPLVYVGSRSFYGFNRELLFQLFGIKNPTDATIRQKP
jgi:Domain of unknown function (DUF4124)/Glutaredoxin